MSAPKDNPKIERLLVVMPTWLGDCVMATPTLRALRGLYPEAQITALIRSTVRAAIEHTPWIDRIVTVRPRRKGRIDARRSGVIPVARRLSKGRFDAAVILPNSFRSALVVTMAGIHRRIGYERDGRGFMLTDRLIPRKQAGEGYIPVPTRDYYLGIVRYLGSVEPDESMQLFTTPAEDEAAASLLTDSGLDLSGDQRLLLINPGAAKTEKCWPAERFAQIADRCAQKFNTIAAVTGTAKESDTLSGVVRAAKTPVINLAERGLTLALLKSIIKRSALLVTNDTGPRHLAAALGTPVVTLFGPTGPEWTEIGFEHERQVVVRRPDGTRTAADAERGLLSMDRMDIGPVFEAVSELLASSSNGAASTAPSEGVGLPT